MRSATSIIAIILLTFGLSFVGCQNPVETEPATSEALPPVDLAAVTQVYEGVIPPFICGSEVVSTMMTGKSRCPLFRLNECDQGRQRQ